MIPKDELNDEQREIIKAAMNTMHELIHGMDNTNGIDPRAIDLLEIAGTLLEQQLEMNVSYPMEEVEPPVLDGLGSTESLASQLGNVEDAVSSGAHEDIIKEGGFLFLKPDEKEEKPSEDLDTFFNLEGDKEE